MLGLRKFFNRNKEKSTTHTLKLALSTMDEVNKFRHALNELEEFSKEEYACDNLERFESLVEDVVACNYGKILLNMTSIMKSTVKLDSDILEYNDRITRALELLEYKEKSLFQKFISLLDRSEKK